MDISKQQNIDSDDKTDGKSINNLANPLESTYHKHQKVSINPMNDVYLQSCSFVTYNKRVTENVSKRKRRRSRSSFDQDHDSDFEERPSKRKYKKSSSYQSDSSDAIQLSRASQPNSPYYSSLPDSPNSSQDEVDSVSFTSTCSTISCTTEDNSQSVNFNTHPSHFEGITEVSTPYGERTPGQICLPQNDIKVYNSENRKSVDEDVNGIYCMTPAAESDTTVRQCPLPSLAWANATDVWYLMCKTDEEAVELRTPQMLEHHPGLQPRMRAILLDWLIEVCEVYKLHRETYYLAVDYLDRYLSAKKMVQKTHLQLIGITCLFVAAKVEEIYPPKIGEFAYVTDGACQEIDILQYEILLLQALDWDISPITAMNWLGVYMQLNVNNKDSCILKTISNVNKLSSTCVDYAFIFPQFSGMKFVHTAKLLDLCSLDVNFANYPYSILAASAISHTFNKETAVRCSGFDWKTLESCSLWMEPFFEVICAESAHVKLTEHNEQVPTKSGLGHICPNIVTDESHMIQTHTISMSMFDHACSLQERYHSAGAKIKEVISPAISLTCPEGLLTPPASSRKPQDVNEDDIDEDASNNVTKCTNIITKA